MKKHTWIVSLVLCVLVMCMTVIATNNDPQLFKADAVTSFDSSAVDSAPAGDIGSYQEASAVSQVGGYLLQRSVKPAGLTIHAARIGHSSKAESVSLKGLPRPPELSIELRKTSLGFMGIGYDHYARADV